MKTGITISAAAHVLVLAGAMVSLASPTPLEVADVEALPVEIVPFEALTKAVQGDRKATSDNPPAPKATTNPQIRPEAENIGNADNDTKAEAPREAPEPPVEKTEPPAPAARPVEKPVKEQETALLAPKPEAKPPTLEPVEEKEVEFPKEVAVPKLRPTVADQPKEDTLEKLLEEQQAVEAAEKAAEQEKVDAEAAAKKAEADAKEKKAAEAAAEKAKQKKLAEAKAKADAKKAADAQKKAVINKAKAAAGGAKRSKKKAGLGTKKGKAKKLAQSEVDALRGRLEGCWSAGILSGNPDAAKIRAQVKFKLTRGGDIDGRVKVKVKGGDRQTKAAFAISVKSAVNECAPYNNLPAEKYETWADVVVNFSLADML